jgi:hypothetical protein
LLKKITAHAAISCFQDARAPGKIKKLIGLYQCTNALGAQDFPHFLPCFKDRDGLQVRLESPRGGLLRPGSITTKGSLFSAVIALCQLQKILS